MTNRHSSDDDETKREGRAEPKPQPQPPLPQHTETTEEIAIKAEMEAAQKRGDANAYDDARARYVVALQRRTALGEQS